MTPYITHPAFRTNEEYTTYLAKNVPGTLIIPNIRSIFQVYLSSLSVILKYIQKERFITTHAVIPNGSYGWCILAWRIKSVIIYTNSKVFVCILAIFWPPLIHSLFCACMHGCKPGSGLLHHLRWHTTAPDYISLWWPSYNFVAEGFTLYRRLSESIDFLIRYT